MHSSPSDFSSIDTSRQIASSNSVSGGDAVNGTNGLYSYSQHSVVVHCRPWTTERCSSSFTPSDRIPPFERPSSTSFRDYVYGLGLCLLLLSTFPSRRTVSTIKSSSRTTAKCLSKLCLILATAPRDQATRRCCLLLHALPCPAVARTMTLSPA